MEFDAFVLAASTADLAEEPAARDHADALELRLDLADAPLDQLRAYAGELPVIVTNRLEAEGGAAADDASRLEALEAALAEPAVEAVDVELAAVEAGAASRVVDAARDHDVAVIASAHDVAGTPDEASMARTLRSAAEVGDLGKLAVTATDLDDALALLSVTRSLSAAGVPVATMAMGEPGRHTRVLAPIYGSRLGFAPVAADRATAPGQFDLATLRALLDAFDVG